MWKIMDKLENYIFMFWILGLYGGIVWDMEVKIIVFLENLYVFYFFMRFYKFVVFWDFLDYDLNILGVVFVMDMDLKGYNVIFWYFIFELEVFKYFKIDLENG